MKINSIRFFIFLLPILYCFDPKVDISLLKEYTGIYEYVYEDDIDENHYIRIELENEQIYDRKISLNFLNQDQISKGNYRKWKYSLSFNHRKYNGKLEKNKLILFINEDDPVGLNNFSPRTFHRINPSPPPHPK